MRVFVLALFAFACGGSQAPAGETALVLQVNYTDDNIDHWHISGVVLSSGRAFGPYNASGDQVKTGETFGLVFDPSDAGTAMVCVEGRDGSTPRANACGMFEIKPNEVSHDSIDLQATH
jgi:hypothetical protein